MMGWTGFTIASYSTGVPVIVPKGMERPDRDREAVVGLAQAMSKNTDAKIEVWEWANGRIVDGDVWSSELASVA
jgi:hypothetical protein